MKKTTVIVDRDSLSKKVRFIRSHMRNMDRHIARAAIHTRISVISAWHVGKGLVMTRSSDDVSGMRSSEWGDFCFANFGMSAAKANRLMKLPEAFGSPDDIPDGCGSVTAAVKAARAALRGLRPTRLRTGSKGIEKGVKDWLVQNWSSFGKRKRSSLGVPYPAIDTLHPEVAVHGMKGGKHASGAIDLLARHIQKDWWTIIEVKAGVAVEADIAQLLLYARMWRTMGNRSMRIDKVFMCEVATPGLKAAAGREGVTLIEWGYTFKSL